MKITQYEIDLMKEIEQAEDAETAEMLKRKLRRVQRYRSIKRTKHARNRIGNNLITTHCSRCGSKQLRNDNYCACCGIANPKVSSWQTRLLSRLADYIASS